MTKLSPQFGPVIEKRTGPPGLVKLPVYYPRVQISNSISLYCLQIFRAEGLGGKLLGYSSSAFVMERATP